MSNLVSFGHIVPELVLGGTAVLLFLLAAIARKDASWQRFLFPGLAGLGLLLAMVLLLEQGLSEGDVKVF